MKKLTVLAAIAIVALSVSATSCDSKKSVKMKSGIDSVSYAIGIANGAGFAMNLGTFPGDPINIDALLAGFEVALKEQNSAMKMTPEEAQTYIQTYVTEYMEREARETKEEGEAFLAENTTKSGVFTTESGLQYSVEKEGDGPKPTDEDRVKVHYTGFLLDGTMFESSVESGEPSVFGVTHVIKGWTEILKLMPVGSKYTIWVPSELAYGERGSREIKPNSVLKFEIELLEIVKE